LKYLVLLLCWLFVSEKDATSAGRDLLDTLAGEWMVCQSWNRVPYEDKRRATKGRLWNKSERLHFLACWEDPRKVPAESKWIDRNRIKIESSIS